MISARTAIAARGRHGARSWGSRPGHELPSGCPGAISLGVPGLIALPSGEELVKGTITSRRRGWQ